MYKAKKYDYNDYNYRGDNFGRGSRNHGRKRG